MTTTPEDADLILENLRRVESFAGVTIHLRYSSDDNPTQTTSKSKKNQNKLDVQIALEHLQSLGVSEKDAQVLIDLVVRGRGYRNLQLFLVALDVKIKSIAAGTTKPNDCLALQLNDQILMFDRLYIISESGFGITSLGTIVIAPSLYPTGLENPIKVQSHQSWRIIDTDHYLLTEVIPNELRAERQDEPRSDNHIKPGLLIWKSHLTQLKSLLKDQRIHPQVAEVVVSSIGDTTVVNNPLSSIQEIRRALLIQQLKSRIIVLVFHNAQSQSHLMRQVATIRTVGGSIRDFLLKICGSPDGLDLELTSLDTHHLDNYYGDIITSIVNALNYTLSGINLLERPFHEVVNDPELDLLDRNLIELISHLTDAPDRRAQALLKATARVYGFTRWSNANGSGWNKTLTEDSVPYNKNLDGAYRTLERPTHTLSIRDSGDVYINNTHRCIVFPKYTGLPLGDEIAARMWNLASEGTRQQISTLSSEDQRILGLMFKERIDGRLINELAEEFYQQGLPSQPESTGEELGFSPII